MSVTEKQRHDLHTWLEEQMGEDRAATLMGYLPPVGWADVATKRDLDHLETTLRAEIAQVRSELALELGRQTRNLTVSFATLMVAFSAALLAIVRVG